jgi:ABC-type multidrug transport system fused ATPase/permease subunit
MAENLNGFSVSDLHFIFSRSNVSKYKALSENLHWVLFSMQKKYKKYGIMKKTKMNKKNFNFNVIKKYLRPQKKALLWAALFVTLENGIQLILPIFYGKAIDVVFEEKTFSKDVLILILAWFVLGLIGELFMRVRIRQGVRIGYKVASDMFTKYLHYLIRLPLSFHKDKKVGELIERFDRADAHMEKIINEGLLQSAPHVVTSFLGFIVIMWIKWELALIYVAFIFVFIFITIRKTAPIIDFNKKISRLFENVYGNIFERTPNVATIKANTSEEREYVSNKKQYNRIYTQIDEYTGLWMNLQFWQHFVFSVGFVLLFLSGLYLIQLKLITVGQFVILLAYVNMASASIQTLGSSYKELQEGLVVIGRSDDLYKNAEEKYDDPKAVPLRNCKGAIEFHDVSLSFNRHRVLKNINFKVKPGQMVAIVGRSGQGKTTLMDLVPRFLVPTSGKVTLDGVDVQKIKLEDLRKHIGIVSQDAGLFHDSIKNNIRYSRMNARTEEIIDVSKKAHCHDFVMKMPKGYDTLVGDRGVKISMGQRQRVAIARAVLRDPKILIFDEATSSLDSESEKNIQDSLEEIMKGRTTFVIAHRLSTIRKADLILVLDDGKIVERGDHAELMRHGGVYKKLHELQHIEV